MLLETNENRQFYTTGGTFVNFVVCAYKDSCQALGVMSVCSGSTSCYQGLKKAYAPTCLAVVKRPPSSHLDAGAAIVVRSIDNAEETPKALFSFSR